MALHVEGQGPHHRGQLAFAHAARRTAKNFRTLENKLQKLPSKKLYIFLLRSRAPSLRIGKRAPDPSPILSAIACYSRGRSGWPAAPSVLWTP